MCDHSDDGGNDDGIDDDGDAKKNIPIKFYPLHCTNIYYHHDDNGK